MRNIKHIKTISTAIGLPLLILSVYHMSSLFFLLFIIVLSTIGIKEFIQITNISGNSIDIWKILIMDVLSTISFYFFSVGDLILVFCYRTENPFASGSAGNGF